jgi:hypothetical protein
LDSENPFEVQTNVSGFVIGRVFMQEGHLIAIESKKLAGVQLKWPIRKKELFAMMNCFKAWQHYLGFHKTKVFTYNVFFKIF